MKKMLSLLLVLSLVFLTACANTEIHDTPTGLTTDTTQTTETTTASEQTSETTTEKKYVYATEIRETEPLQTEIPELQEKIDRNQEKFPWIANKIVIEIDETRYVPYLMQGHYGTYYDQEVWTWMGGGTDGRVHADMAWLDERIESVWHIHQGDTFRLYKNDVLQEKLWFTVLDYSEDENQPKHCDYYDFSTMCETLGSGRHYVYTQVRCEGDYILINGERGETEYADFLVFFILEIE